MPGIRGTHHGTMGKEKASKKGASRKVDKVARKTEKAACRETPTTPVEPSPPPPAQPSLGYTLEQAARVLPSPDATLESAIRQAYSDEQLQTEGAKVASDRIVEDGERLCSQALLLLQSDDEDIKNACAKAGLTRPLVALLVHGLLRLDGVAHQTQQATLEGQKARATSAANLEQAVAEGRRLRLEIRNRLEAVALVDAAVNKQLASSSVQPTSADGLAQQLDALAGVLQAILSGKDATTHGLAMLRGLSKEDVSALKQAAERLRRGAQEQGSDGRAGAAERQARLDVLDGYCLVLIAHVLGALRGVARRTRKVRRPSLIRLRSYFQGRSRDEDEPEPAPPAE
ncbi:MAG: hypothetical protein RMJ98_00900 [Myxococcales bacterium]|nr:hypothetical protein [Polyangiaceae bacterium]MDW8247844.1 hypothetical protein [Myxococcales bacterium]